MEEGNSRRRENCLAFCSMQKLFVKIFWKEKRGRVKNEWREKGDIGREMQSF
jgi:hypothetical protein